MRRAEVAVPRKDDFRRARSNQCARRIEKTVVCFSPTADDRKRYLSSVERTLRGNKPVEPAQSSLLSPADGKKNQFAHNFLFRKEAIAFTTPYNHQIMATTSSPRIPLELQQIFLASNAGETVHEPPQGLGFKVFKKVLNLGSSRHGRRVSSFRRQSWDKYESPQTLLETMISERGYGTKKTKAVETSFRVTPTPYELASYNSASIHAVKTDRSDMELREMLQAGLSPNACQRNGDSLFHMACRLGKHQHVRTLLEYGADLHVCSSLGRTVLHDACYGQRPSFQTFALIVKQDPSLLFMMDCRGLCPLEYIRTEHFVFWFEYLESNVDKFWPVERMAKPTHLDKPFTRTLSKPANALAPELAHMVASGKMTSKEALLLVNDRVVVQASTGKGQESKADESTFNDDCSESSSTTESSSSDESSLVSSDESFWGS